MEIREEDYHIQLIDMEYGIHEQIAKASDGHHTIFLNARDAHNQRLIGYKHAIEHLNRKDYEKTNVQKIETEAHLIEKQVPVPQPEPEKPKKKRRDPEAEFERQWARLQKKLARKRKDLAIWNGKWNDL